MRTILSSLAIVGLLTTAAIGADDPRFGNICSYAQIPPKEFQREPNVNYVIVESSSPCGGRAVACTEQYAPGKWVIEMPDNLNASNKYCVIKHEKAHLPPNNWSPGHNRKCDSCAKFNPNKRLISNYGRRFR